MTTGHLSNGSAMGRMARVMKGAAMLPALMALSGCLSLSGEAPDKLMRLTPDASAPAGRTVTGKIADAVVVMDPVTDRSLDVPRVPVQVDASTIAYVKDLTWVEKPSRQFRSLLAETLRTRTDRLVIEGSGFEVAGKIRLSGRLIDMGYDAQTQSVVVRFDAVRSDDSGEATAARFESVVPGVAPKAESIAPALNEAANSVAEQVVTWFTSFSPPAA